MVFDHRYRRRLARRFSIIGAANGFEVLVDCVPISPRDRGYYDKIEFLWHIGNLEGIDDGFFRDAGSRDELRENIRKNTSVDGVVDAAKGWTAGGWIGTVDEQKSIDEENNAIVVFARGKLIHEDVLGDLKEGGIYSKYLIGEIDADFMDSNDEDDIVTSDRQSVKQDDERYGKLRAFIQSILKDIQNQWTELRRDVGTERATQHPGVKAWYERLQGDRKKMARKMFGKIESLKISEAAAKMELYKSSLFAFERLALKDSLNTLDALETETDFRTLTSLFGTVDELEAVHYYEIANGRLKVIEKLEADLPEAKERVIQQHIFEHLWLLDPSWERAASSERIEEAVTTEFGKSAKLTKEEEDGRLDIRYKTTANKHVIIELKKYDRSVAIEDLVKQVRKYRSALGKMLRGAVPGGEVQGHRDRVPVGQDSGASERPGDEQKSLG